MPWKILYTWTNDGEKTDPDVERSPNPKRTEERAENNCGVENRSHTLKKKMYNLLECNRLLP